MSQTIGAGSTGAVSGYCGPLLFNKKDSNAFVSSGEKQYYDYDQWWIQHGLFRFDAKKQVFI
jgi:hypothetical protein